MKKQRVLLAIASLIVVLSLNFLQDVTKNVDFSEIYYEAKNAISRSEALRDRARQFIEKIL